MNAPTEIPPKRWENTPSAKALVLGVLSTLIGFILGGLAGGTIALWLCIMIVFGVFPPWKIPPNMDQAGLLLLPVALMGGIIGALTGGRYLYLWVVRWLSPHSEPEDPNREDHTQPEPDRKPEDLLGVYLKWKQEHARQWLKAVSLFLLSYTVEDLSVRTLEAGFYASGPSGGCPHLLNLTLSANR